MKITQEQYDDAARAVLVALRQRRATSNRRLHVDRYKKHAAPILGIASVYPARWAEVLDAGRRLGLFKVDRKTLKKPFFVDLGADLRPSSYTATQSNPAPAPAIVDDVYDEDTSDDPTVSAAASERISNVNSPTHVVIMYRKKTQDRLLGMWQHDRVMPINSEKLKKRLDRWSRFDDLQVVVGYMTIPNQ